MRERILKALYEAVDETNRSRPGAQPLERSPQTKLYGTGSDLDSLGLINFIVATEQKIETLCGRSIMLADDRALSQAVSPFQSVETLASYIEQLLGAES